MDDRRVAATATIGSAVADAARGAGGAHLFVIEEGSSRIVPLLQPSLVTIGRGPTMTLQLDHASVSRQHAQIQVDVRGEVRIVDSGSHNGTTVNGKRISDSHALATGDVIAIGEVVLVVHADLAEQVPEAALDIAAWRRALAKELRRAAEYRRPFSVLAIDGAALDSTRAVRPIDVVGSTDGGCLVVLPEADPRIARDIAESVLHAVAPASSGPTETSVRIGIASYPTDVIDADGLVAAAVAAAAAARPNGVATVADTVEELALGTHAVVVCHPAMREVYRLAKRLADKDMVVLVTGENGVGKEHVAQALHHGGRRSGAPFVAQNCAALGENLVESALFGHAKGAFTGAVAAQRGLFESAAGGTLFLDEIGELPPVAQAKLLRALETRRIMRVGETTERDVDVRVVAATNRVLRDEIAAGRFREDLYYRLGGERAVHIPPLRERRCEIPILFHRMLARAAERVGRTPPVPAPLALARLLAHPWPGNVRELRNLAEYLIATVEDDRIEPEDLPTDFATEVRPPPPPPPPPRESRDGTPMRAIAEEVAELERRRMTEALERTGGVKTRAAELIGMALRTFNEKFRRYGL